MKIRTRLYISGVITTSFVLAIFVLLVDFYINLNSELKSTAIANQLVKETTDLILLADDYLITQHQRSEVQWKSKLKNISDIVHENQLVARFADIEIELKLLESNFQMLQEEVLVTRVLINQKAAPTEIEKSKLKISMLSSQVRQSGNLILNVVYRHSRSAEEDIRNNFRRDSLILLTISGLLILALVPIIFTSTRRITRPLSELLENVNRVDMDNLDSHLFNMSKTKQKDEVSKLAFAFEEMIHRLQTAHLALKRTHDDLERKVEERTAEYQQATVEAENANLAKTEFLANISHELRNPMHQILSYAKYGVEKIDKPKEKLWHYFNQARKAAERLMVLLNDLLDLSKMESGRMDYSFNTNNVYQIVSEAVSELRPAYEDKDIELKLTEPDIPTTTSCDYYKIGQVVRNLLSNAIKFTPNNKSIEIEFFKKEIRNSQDSLQYLQVSICDHGVGLPENELHQVFEKFTQSSITKSGAGGTGLGLAISREIIKAHRGDIWAVNNSNSGSTFSFTIPYNNSVSP